MVWFLVVGWLVGVLFLGFWVACGWVGYLGCHLSFVFGFLGVFGCCGGVLGGVSFLSNLEKFGGRRAGL